MWAAWRNRNNEIQKMKKETELEIVEVIKEVDKAEYEGYKAVRFNLYGVSESKKRYFFKRLRKLGFGVTHHYGHRYLITW